MKGQKIRTPEAETFLRTFRLLGANPVGVPFGETYLAIKNGVVDGMEGVPDIIFNQKFYEVGKYVAKTGHIMATLQILASEKTLQSLPPEHRKIVEEEAAAAWLKQRQAAQVSNEKAESDLAAKGVEFTTVDFPPSRRPSLRFGTNGPKRPAWRRSWRQFRRRDRSRRAGCASAMRRSE